MRHSTSCLLVSQILCCFRRSLVSCVDLLQLFCVRVVCLSASQFSCFVSAAAATSAAQDVNLRRSALLMLFPYRKPLLFFDIFYVAKPRVRECYFLSLKGTEYVLCLPNYYLITGSVRLCKTLHCLYVVMASVDV